MLRKLFTLLLVLSLAAPYTPVWAKSKSEKQAEFALKVKTGIEKLGVGENTQVAVKLRDKTRIKGFIRDAGEDSFVVADSRTGSETTIAFANVAQVRGNNLSTGAKIAIGVGLVAILVIIIIIALKYGGNKIIDFGP